MRKCTELWLVWYVGYKDTNLQWGFSVCQEWLKTWIQTGKIKSFKLKFENLWTVHHFRTLSTLHWLILLKTFFE